MRNLQDLISITSDDLAVATDAAFPGLPHGMSMEEAQSRIDAALESYTRRLRSRIAALTEEEDKVDQS